MQLIEGEAKSVRLLMSSIAADDRHDRIAYVADESKEFREFDGWALGCIDYGKSSNAGEFLADVKAAVSNVADKNISAAFTGFAILAKRSPSS